MAASEERVKPWRDLPWPDRWKLVWEHEAGHRSARAGVGAQCQAGKQGRGGSMGHLVSPGGLGLLCRAGGSKRETFPPLMEILWFLATPQEMHH